MGKLAGCLLKAIGQRAQQAGAVRRLAAAPAVFECSCSRSHGGIDIGRPTAGDLRPRFQRVGVLGVEPLAAGGIAELATDVEGKALHRWLRKIRMGDALTGLTGGRALT